MLNSAILMGRICNDLELKTTNNNISVCSFTVAVDRAYQAQGQERQTDFINCVAWRHNAEFITKYFSKGQMIAIEGSIQTRSYEDKNGNKRTAFEVIVDRASFCGGKNENASNNTQADISTPDVAFDEADSFSDDLPF